MAFFNEDDVGWGETASGDAENTTSLSALFKAQDRTLLAALTTDAIMLSVVVVVYCLLHSRFASFYYDNPLRRGRGPAAPGSAFGWVPLLLGMDDGEIERYAGLDALFFLQFIRMVLQLLTFTAFTYGLLELVVNLSCSFFVAERFFPAGGVARLSLANVPAASDGEVCTWVTMAASTCGVWILTACTLWILRRGWLRVIEARWRFMVEARDASSRVVLVLGATERKLKAEVLTLWQEMSS